MIALPLYLFLLLYLFIVAVFVIIYFVHIYHLVATASVSLVSTTVTVLVGGFMTLIILFTFLLLANTIWSAGIPLFNFDWFPGMFSPQTF